MTRHYPKTPKKEERATVEGHETNEVSASAAGTPPVNSVVPVIEQNGNVIHCTDGEWAEDPPVDALEYHWRITRVPPEGPVDPDAPVVEPVEEDTGPGFESSTYIMVSRDVGGTLMCTVVARNGDVITSVDTNALVVEQPPIHDEYVHPPEGGETGDGGDTTDGTPPPGPTAPPVVRDTPYVSQQDDMISCTMGNWDGEPTSYLYEWTLDGVIMPADATDRITVIPSDVGKVASCVVTAGNALGSTIAPVSNTVVIAPW